MPLVAGVDSSTQSVKVVVRDAETGDLVREGRATHPDGTEVHPDHWWSALEEASAGLLDGVEAMAVAAQQHGMVALDEAGEVVRPALLWNDTRSAQDAADLVAEDAREFRRERCVLLERRAAGAAEIVGEVEGRLPAALGRPPQRPQVARRVVAQLREPVEGDPHRHDDADDDRRHEEQLHEEARRGGLDGRQRVVLRHRAAGGFGHGLGRRGSGGSYADASV